ncbi:MAG: Rieske 2Fe-2S domain-containing protein [Pseudomonadota bacterium]
MNTQESTWYPVARADDLPPRHVFQGQLNGLELALWRADHGRVNAWENRCPHRSVRFSLGVNTGDRLRCQYHGWQYRSGDGRCTVIPASSGSAPPASLCAQTFAVAEAHGYVWVNPDAPSPQPAGAALIPAFEPLSATLRSLVFNAGVDEVEATLAHYAEHEPDAIPGSSTLSRNGIGIDLAWQNASGARRLRLWLQPAHATKTIVHGSASFDGIGESEVRRRCNDVLTLLRRHVEGRAVSAPRGAVASPATKPRVIPVFQRAPEKIVDTVKEDKGRAPMRATVAARRTTAEDIVAFTLALPAGESVDFEAGAHIDVHTPGGVVRQYSLVNAPGERDRLVIGVKLEPDSRGGSRSMHAALQPGDSLTISHPKNHFPLVPGAGGVLIAGGIGITPILAMGAALQYAGLPYSLHYFVRGKEHAAFGERLEKLGGLQMHTGLAVEQVTAAVDAALADAGNARHIYACGPRPLIDLVQARARLLGIASERVHFELFANTVAHERDEPFRVRLQSTGAEFQVPAGVSLSDALKEHGVAIETSCEQGVCGTCRTGVIDGEPEHRDVYLNEQERQGRRCLMPCVSRSRSSLLVLDL